MDINPGDYTANESAEHLFVDDSEPMPGEDLTELAAFPVLIQENPEDALLKQLIHETRATRQAAEQLVSLFSEAVTTVNALAAKADGLFGGGDEGPKLSGPAGMILSALLPKK